MWKLVQVCFNEYWRRVPGLVVHAGSLGVLIGEYVKPGYKLRKRAHIGGPELRTKKQEPRNKKQEPRNKHQETRSKKSAFATASRIKGSALGKLGLAMRSECWIGANVFLMLGFQHPSSCLHFLAKQGLRLGQFFLAGQ